MPGIQYPRVPGHEVIGVIDAVGPDVPPRWTAGQRVGVGWHALALQLLRQLPPRRLLRLPERAEGDRPLVRRRVRRVHGRARPPRWRSSRTACRAPTARRSCAPASRPSTRCATAAPGPATWSRCSASAGWGTWACSTPPRWASSPSASPAARTRSRSPGNSARPITSTARRSDPAAELQKLGGAKVVLATVTAGAAMAATIGGLAPQRQAAGPRRRRPDAGRPAPAAAGSPVDRGVVFRHVHRFPGHAELQRPVRGQIDERDLPAGTGRRGVRPDDERQGAVPGGADDGARRGAKDQGRVRSR